MNFMNTQTKIYLLAAAGSLCLITLIVSSTWSNRQIAKLENAVGDAKAIAIEQQQAAAVSEINAAQYKQKIDYLEAKLTEIGQLARKQDEHLEILTNNSRTARSDVERARHTRSVTTTHAELCHKLAELGHPCG